MRRLKTPVTPENFTLPWLLPLPFELISHRPVAFQQLSVRYLCFLIQARNIFHRYIYPETKRPILNERSISS